MQVNKYIIHLPVLAPGERTTVLSSCLAQEGPFKQYQTIWTYKQRLHPASGKGRAAKGRKKKSALHPVTKCAHTKEHFVTESMSNLMFGPVDRTSRLSENLCAVFCRMIETP